MCGIHSTDCFILAVLISLSRWRLSQISTGIRVSKSKVRQKFCRYTLSEPLIFEPFGVWGMETQMPAVLVIFSWAD